LYITLNIWDTVKEDLGETLDFVYYSVFRL
jgi:hypothetical protein